MNPRDVENLTQYWTATQRTVAAFLRTLVPDPHQSEDLLQQVAVVIVRKFPQYDRSRSFPAWAIGVAKQEVLAHRRRLATERHVFDNAMIERIAATYEQYLSDDVSNLRDTLERCRKKLQGRAKMAMDLHYSQGMETVQIAGQLGIGHGAVRMLLSRTRDALRSCIEQQLGRSLAEL